MITYARSVTVYVRDQEVALDFFVNKLGFVKEMDEQFGPGMRWLQVAPPGAQTAVVLAHGYGDYDESRVGRFSGIVWTADDIQATYKEMTRKGVAFSEPPTLQPWGMMQAIFADPDGNGYVLVGARAQA